MEYFWALKQKIFWIQSPAIQQCKHTQSPRWKSRPLCILWVLLSSYYHFYNIVKLILKAFWRYIHGFYLCLYGQDLVSRDTVKHGNKNPVGWRSFFKHALTLSFPRAMALNGACGGNRAQPGIVLKDHKVLLKIIIYGKRIVVGFVSRKGRILLYAHHQGTVCTWWKHATSL